jgi:type IV pilus modification protein PilV
MSKIYGKNERGFTLIEVMVAIVILTIGLISLAGLLTTTMRSTTFGKNTTIANNLAQQELEDIRRQATTNFASVIDSVAGSDPVNGVNPDQTEVITNYIVDFTREVYISDIDANSKDVAVRVLWTDVIGATHPTILRTILAE